MEPFVSFIHLISIIMFVAALAYGGISDLRSFEISNRVPLVIFISFFPAALTAGWETIEILKNLSAFLFVLGVCFALFSFKIIGGGDAKFLAAACLWFGWGVLAPFLFLVAIGGGILSLLILVFRRFQLPATLYTVAWIKRLHSHEPGVPYGIAITIAGIILISQIEVITPSLLGF